MHGVVLQFVCLATAGRSRATYYIPGAMFHFLPAPVPDTSVPVTTPVAGLKELLIDLIEPVPSLIEPVTR